MIRFLIKISFNLIIVILCSSCEDKHNKDSEIFLNKIGSSSFDEGYGLTIDDEGSIIISGIFNEKIFFNNDHSFSIINKGSSDIFVAKYSKAGELLWASSFGNNKNDEAYNVTTDNSGNVYVCGYLTDSISNMENALVLKLDKNGNLLWNKVLVSSAGAEANDIKWRNGELIVTGFFYEQLSVNSNVLHSNGGSDIFIVRMNEDGEVIKMISYGFNQDDIGKNICLLANGEFAICGSVTQNNQKDIAFMHFNKDLTVIDSSFFGTRGNDNGLSLISNKKGNFFLTGQFEGDTIFSNDKRFPVNYHGKSDGMICKLNERGAVEWLYTLGSAENDWVTNAALTKDENLIFTTVLNHNAEIHLNQNITYEGKGNYDIFITMLDSNDQTIKYIGYGSSGEDGANRVRIDKENNVYLSGWFYESLEFPKAKQKSNGDGDAFLYKGKLEELMGK